MDNENPLEIRKESIKNHLKFLSLKHK